MTTRVNTRAETDGKARKRLFTQAMFMLDPLLTVIYICFFLSDPSPATIEKLDSPQSFIKEGQNARFHCTVSGSPRPNVTWRRGQEIVAFCAGKYNSACNKTFKSRYKANWRDDRGCMRNYSMGPTSGGWVSWLNVNNLQYPADVKYTCEVENSLGKKKKVASLKIAGKLKTQFHFHIISFILFHSISYL